MNFIIPKSFATGKGFLALQKVLIALQKIYMEIFLGNKKYGRSFPDSCRILSNFLKLLEQNIILYLICQLSHIHKFILILFLPSQIYFIVTIHFYFSPIILFRIIVLLSACPFFYRDRQLFHIFSSLNYFLHLIKILYYINKIYLFYKIFT